MNQLEKNVIITKGLIDLSFPELAMEGKNLNLYRVCKDFQVVNDLLIKINHDALLYGHIWTI